MILGEGRDGIHGLERRIDKGGIEARRFGALVPATRSSMTPAGKLLFEGGSPRRAAGRLDIGAATA